MMFLKFLGVWLLSGLTVAAVWALLSIWGRRVNAWAVRELETQEALRQRGRQLDASWCSACGWMGGEHARDCAFVLEVRRS